MTAEPTVQAAGTAPAVVEISGVSKVFEGGRQGAGRVEALVGIDLSITCRRVRLADRPVRLREVDAAADRRRPDLTHDRYA